MPPPEPTTTDHEGNFTRSGLRAVAQTRDARETEPGSELRDVMELGRGGMGVVSLVLDDEGHTFARKKLLPELARDPGKRELFLREAQVTLGLVHPNVVRTYRTGDEEGEPFLVMDFVDGMPLDRLLALARESGETLPRHLAAHLVARLAAGLHAAHELSSEDGTPLNLVHRDISPHNVMVSRAGEVVLLDFGVAKIDTTRGLTKTGEVRGKTSYMSPEQGLGDPLDRRSDLFSLGAILFECVQGTRMWGDGTELDVLRKLALETPPAIDADDAVSRLHARLVARDPEDRPATAREVSETLAAYAMREGEDDDALLSRARNELAAWVERTAERELSERQKVLAEAIAPVRASLPGAAVAEVGFSSEATAHPLGDEAPRGVSRLHAPTRPSRGAVVGLALAAAIGTTLVFVATHQRPTASLEPHAEFPKNSVGVTSAALPSSSGSQDARVERPATSASASPPPFASASSPPSTRSAAKPQVTPAPSALPAHPSASASNGKAPVAPLNVDPTPF